MSTASHARLSLGEIAACLRTVPDFPQPGVLFRDITPLLSHPEGLASVTAYLQDALAGRQLDGIIAIEARGFLLGAPLAVAMRLPLLLARKPGKLPAQTVHAEYVLEYGVDRIEMHADSLQRFGRYALIDDVLASGGTAATVLALAQQVGAEIAHCAFLIELNGLGGRARLGATPVSALLAL
jgi:adenine phosphoribosyltransferase